MQTPFSDTLLAYIRAGYPLLYIPTHEEERVTKDIYKVNQQAYTSEENSVDYREWDALQELCSYDKNGKLVRVPGARFTLEDLFNKIAGLNKQTCIVLKGYHTYISNPVQIRTILNVLPMLKRSGHVVIIVSPVVTIPVELSSHIQLMDYKLPDASQLRADLDVIQKAANAANAQINSSTELEEALTDKLLDAAKGMTSHEASNAFALAVVKHRKFDLPSVTTVFEEKVKLVKKSGLLTYIPPDGTTFDTLGGMHNLKKWIHNRAGSYTTKARQYGLPYPRGVLLTGVQGGGKTLSVKAIAAAMQVPLFQLDIGSLFSKFVGETEANVRQVVNTVDSLGRCILFIDEVEKGLHKEAVAGRGDSGTSSRAFATILSWLNDRQSSAFIVVTSNDFTVLPAAFVRKGRFDELWWVDLPSDKEREEIFRIVLSKYKREVKPFNLKTLVRSSEGYTGAEIDAAFVDAMFHAFADNSREVTTLDVVDALNRTKPLSITNKEELETMRLKAAGLLRPVSSEVSTATLTDSH
jgi:ATP-dependent 26S proteasome regulatory subunit